MRRSVGLARRQQAGLAEIALVPGVFALISTLGTAPWRMGHLWRQSAGAALLFGLSALACAVLVAVANTIASAGGPGMPHLTGFVICMGLVGWQIYLLWQLHHAPVPFPLGQAVLLNHGLGYDCYHQGTDGYFFIAPQPRPEKFPGAVTLQAGVRALTIRTRARPGGRSGA